MEEEATDEIKVENVWEDGSIWQNLPDDLIIDIFSFLDCNSLLTASKTCTKWRRVASDESLWRDLLCSKVRLSKKNFPECKSFYEEYRRLCINVPVLESECLREHEDEVYHVMFSPSGKYFSTTGKDGRVVVWKLGAPTKKYAMAQVVESPSYTRFSEFNPLETKLLVAGMDLGLYYDGFIKIYQFGKNLSEICLSRIEFPNFRGAWYDDISYISMKRISDETNGYYLQVRSHEASKLMPLEHQKLLNIRHVCHRNDFIRVIDKSKWPEKLYGREGFNMEMSTKDSEEDQESVTESCDEENNEESIIVCQTSIEHQAAINLYPVKDHEQKAFYFTEPKVLHESDCTIIGINLSSDHRFLVYNIRQKIPGNGFSSYSENIEVRVYDLQNNRDTGEVYKGALSTGEDHVSYIFPAISEDFISCGSENLKGYIWDRKYGILLSELNHECGINSQNGVNATAFCPTDQEILITVADDLNVRIWRSKQRTMEFQQAKARIRNNSENYSDVCPNSSKTHLKNEGSTSSIDSPTDFNFCDDNMDDVDDGSVTCCSGFRPRSKKARKRETQTTVSVHVLDIDL